MNRNSLIRRKTPSSRNAIDNTSSVYSINGFDSQNEGVPIVTISTKKATQPDAHDNSAIAMVNVSLVDICISHLLIPLKHIYVS